MYADDVSDWCPEQKVVLPGLLKKKWTAWSKSNGPGYIRYTFCLSKVSIEVCPLLAVFWTRTVVLLTTQISKHSYSNKKLNNALLIDFFLIQVPWRTCGLWLDWWWTIIDKSNRHIGSTFSVTLWKSISTSCCNDREGVDKGDKGIAYIRLDH